MPADSAVCCRNVGEWEYQITYVAITLVIVSPFGPFMQTVL